MPNLGEHDKEQQLERLRPIMIFSGLILILIIALIILWFFVPGVQDSFYSFLKSEKFRYAVIGIVSVAGFFAWLEQEERKKG